MATTPSRTLYSSTAYAPFGEPYQETGSTDRSFTGEDQDTVSGLYDFLYRKQNPAQGRWLSPDPAGLAAVDPGNPQSWNRYAYVGNNPLSFVDPLGLEQQCVWIETYFYVAGDRGSGLDLICTDEPRHGGGGGGGGGGNHGGGGGGGQQPPPDPNTVTIAAYHPSIAQCLAEAAVDAGLDLTSLSILPGANQDSWRWQSAGWNSGFVYTGAAESGLGPSTAVDVVERTADWVEGSPWAQGEIRQFLRSEGVKWSVKHISKDAALLGKVAGAIGKVLAAKSAYDRYQKCQEFQ